MKGVGPSERVQTFPACEFDQERAKVSSVRELKRSLLPPVE
jgi:hypothetical protein